MSRPFKMSMAGLALVHVFAAAVSVVSQAGQTESVLSQLSNPVRPIAGLDGILATTEKEPRVPLSSSFFFKGILRNVESSILSFQKSGKPVVVDPSQTLEQLNAKIKAQEDHVCNQAFAKLPGGFDSLLTTVMFRLKDTAANETSRQLSKAEQKVSTPAEQKRLINILRSHIEAAPRTTKDSAVLTLLGQPTRVDFMANRIRRIHFARNEGSTSKILPMSFSMLASYRSGRDEAFVKVQACLVNYLEAQQRVLTNRKTEIDSSKSVRPTDEIFAIAGIRSIPTSNLYFENLTGEKRAAYELKHFLEGKSFGEVNAERAFITTRLSRINESMPYLKERLAGAIEANQLMSRLGKGQIDDLLGMFVQLMRDDFPTPEKMAALDREARTSVGETQAFAEKYAYYKQLSEDLINLDQALREEKMTNAAIKQDLEEIRTQSRP